MSEAVQHPTFGSGKICYIEIPADDVQGAADFYVSAFGWNIRTHDDGSLAFDDGVGEVSGMWVRGRMPATEAGFVISIMVPDAVMACSAVVAAGGEIVKPADPNAREVTAWFRDPFGNLMGIYEHRGIEPER
jgi:predicted enzyme related to lactoylglutathione lyase